MVGVVVVVVVVVVFSDDVTVEYEDDLAVCEWGGLVYDVYQGSGLARAMPEEARAARRRVVSCIVGGYGCG